MQIAPALGSTSTKSTCELTLWGRRRKAPSRIARGAAEDREPPFPWGRALPRQTSRSAMQLAVISPSFLPWHPLWRHPWLVAAKLCQRGRLPFPCFPASAAGLFLSSDVPGVGRTSRNYRGAIRDWEPVWARRGLGTKPIPPVLPLSRSQDGLWLFWSRFSNFARDQKRIQH